MVRHLDAAGEYVTKSPVELQRPGWTNASSLVKNLQFIQFIPIYPRSETSVE